MNQLSQHEITAYLGRFQAPLQTAEEIAERDQMDSCSAIAQMAVLMSAEHRDQLRAVNDEHTMHMQTIVHNMHSANEVDKARIVTHCESKIHDEVESAARTRLSAVAHMNGQNRTEWAVGRRVAN